MDGHVALTAKAAPPRTVSDNLEWLAREATDIAKRLAALAEVRGIIKEGKAGNRRLTMRYNHRPGDPACERDLLSDREFDRHMHDAAMAWVDKSIDELEKKAARLVPTP